VRPPQRSRLAWGLFGLTAALLVTALLLGMGADNVVLFPVTLSLGLVGAVISSRTGNRVGWLFVADGAVIGLCLVTQAYASGPHAAARPGAAWAGWAFAILLEVGTIGFFLIPLLFPDGRPPSPRWWPVVWLQLAVGLFGVALVSVSAVNFPANFPHLHDPVTVLPASALAAFYEAKQGLQALLFVVSAAAVIVRLVRSSGEERLQLKWFTYAAALAALALAVAAVLIPQPVIAFAVFFPLIPVAAGFAIMKYRLYDIDVVISKTVVYGSLAAFITAVYVLVVVGIGSLGSGSLHAGSRPSPGLSILATAVVAVAFQPVRERAQHLANRLVFGKRATPYQALSEFAGRMGGAYAAEDVLPRMARVLAEGTGADRAVVWLKDGAELAAGACWPADAGPPRRAALPGGEVPAIVGAGRIALVSYQGKTLGALSVSKRPGENLTPVEDKLMSDLAAQAGLVMRNIGLTEQLRARLAELQASRLRIVAAQDDQRRRIERDIHDGAQQQLLAIAAKLAAAESVAGQDHERERALVAQLKAETSGALETLRELARGIYPPLLADQGLAAAVTTQAGKAPVPVEVDAGALGRYPAEIETAIYFCCVEALQNAARHAPGSAVRVSLAEDRGQVMFTVTDDGPGFDPAATAAPVAGSGLRNMRDRLVALGGSCQVDSRPGRGTTVAGRIGLPDAAAENGGPARRPHAVENWS
jgi:signal transduction histidine kinase